MQCTVDVALLRLVWIDPVFESTFSFIYLNIYENVLCDLGVEQ